jgi:accessory colonization factor AcfC
MVDVIKYLHDTLDFSCVCEPKQIAPQSANINISAMPVWKFMDTITEIYTDTEWEYRKSGVIVVRGPMNSTRDKKQKDTDIVFGIRK